MIMSSPKAAPFGSAACVTPRPTAWICAELEDARTDLLQLEQLLRALVELHGLPLADREPVAAVASAALREVGRIEDFIDTLIERVTRDGVYGK